MFGYLFVLTLAAFAGLGFFGVLEILKTKPFKPVTGQIDCAIYGAWAMFQLIGTFVWGMVLVEGTVPVSEPSGLITWFLCFAILASILGLCSFVEVAGFDSKRLNRTTN